MKEGRRTRAIDIYSSQDEHNWQELAANWFSFCSRSTKNNGKVFYKGCLETMLFVISFLYWTITLLQSGQGYLDKEEILGICLLGTIFLTGGNLSIFQRESSIAKTMQ